MKYSTAIFDMDGTILDTLDDLSNTMNYALRVHGYPERTRAEARAFIGNGIHRLVELSVPSGTSEEKIEEVFATYNEYYAVHCRDLTRPYEGITDLVRKLRDLGMHTAVVSNKADYAVQTLNEEFFPGVFDYAVGSSASVRRKPAPDTVNEVLRKCGCSSGNAVYIGDTEVDLATAENAGMDCLIVGWGFRDAEQLYAAGAEKILYTMEDLYREITQE